MDSLDLELGKVSMMPLVAKAYLTSDEERVVVELVVNQRAGLKAENLLFFQPQTFTADQVKVQITKIKKESATRS